MSTPTIHTIGKSRKIVIDQSIYEIERGKAFFVSDEIVQAAGVNNYTFIYPKDTTKKYHISFKFSSYPQSGVWLYEGTGSATTGSGTALTSYCLNRNEATGSLIVVKDITTGSSGTGSQIFRAYIPDWTVDTFGAPDTRLGEMIIKDATPYLLRFSGSATGRIGVGIFWYETS